MRIEKKGTVKMLYLCARVRKDAFIASKEDKQDKTKEKSIVKKRMQTN